MCVECYKFTDNTFLFLFQQKRLKITISNQLMHLIPILLPVKWMSHDFPNKSQPYINSTPQNNRPFDTLLY